jgi:hypothetical protein
MGKSSVIKEGENLAAILAAGDRGIVPSMVEADDHLVTGVHFNQNPY